MAKRHEDNWHKTEKREEKLINGKMTQRGLAQDQNECEAGKFHD